MNSTPQQSWQDLAQLFERYRSIGLGLLSDLQKGTLNEAEISAGLKKLDRLWSECADLMAYVQKGPPPPDSALQRSTLQQADQVTRLLQRVQEELRKICQQTQRSLNGIRGWKQAQGTPTDPQSHVDCTL